MEKSNNFNLDKTGIICSSACAIHCLLLPIITYLAPNLSYILDNEWIHLTLLAVLIPIALIAFIKSKKIHKKLIPILCGASGVFLLVLAVFLENMHIEIQYLEKVLTGLGSILLIIGHILNIRSLAKTVK